MAQILWAFEFSLYKSNKSDCQSYFNWQIQVEIFPLEKYQLSVQ